MKQLIAAFGLVGIFGWGAAMADDTLSNGNGMLLACQYFINAQQNQNPANDFQGGVCAGFVAGVSNTLTAVRFSSPDRIPICIPDGFTFGQGARVFIKYMENHPEQLNQNPTSLAITAFREAFPCP